ncbi:hypothetical protein APHAL10511_002184 [Amanita phalloides]|nr:hypothetical protein APHAL10511_002184 [Amanita phalloides]
MDDDVVETSDVEELAYDYYTSPRDDGPSPRKRIKLCHSTFPFTSDSPPPCISRFKTPEKKRQSGSRSPALLTVTSQKSSSSIQIPVDDVADAGSTLCIREVHSPSPRRSHDPLLLKTPPESRSLASTPTNVRNNDQLVAFSERPNLPPESSFVNYSDMDSLFTPPSSNINNSPAKRNHTVISSSPASTRSMPSSPLTVLSSPQVSTNQRAPLPLSATHLDQHGPEPLFSGQSSSNPPEQIDTHETPDDDSGNVSRYPLRPRQPVQLHPYFIDKVYYKQALRGNPEAMVLVRSPERNRRVQEYEGTQIETQETEYTPVSRSDRSRSRTPSHTRGQDVIRPTESEQSPVHYPEILQDLPSSDEEEKEARREVSKEIRKTQKGQIRGRMQHLRNPKSFPLLLAGAVGSRKRRDSSGSDASHAPQMSPRFRRSVVDADGEGGDDILPAVAPSGSSSPTTIFQNDALSPEWRNQDLDQMADASGELSGLNDFGDSQSSDHNVPTSRESTPGSEKVILDKKRLKVLGRMMPKSMINGLMHRRTLPERAPQNRQRSATVVSEEDLEGPLLPGQTRVRKITHTRFVQDVRGDSNRSEEDGRSTECETTSSDVEVVSSKWTRDVITVSDTENDSGNSLNGSSDEDIGDEDIQAYMDNDAQSDAREVNLIDRMLSRTWTVGNGTKPRSTTRDRRPRKKKYALDIVTGGAKHSKGRQMRLDFDNHTSAPRRSGFRPVPVRDDKASDAFQHMTEAAKRQRKRKTNQRHKANGLYVFSGKGKRRIISGRSEVQPVSVDMYVDTREAYNDWADAFQPPGSLRDRAIVHQADRNHRVVNALTKKQRRNMAADSDEGDLSADDGAISPTLKAPSNMGMPLLPPGITFGDQTYVGKRRLEQLISTFSSTMQIPEPTPCDLRGYNLRSDMTLDDFSRTLHRIREDIVEFSTGLPEVDQVERLHEWDIVSRAVFRLLSWFRASGDDQQRGQLQRIVERNASAIVDHIRELDLTSKSLDSAILQLDWFTVELLARAGCKASLSGSDTATSNVFHKTLALLVDHLIDLDVLSSVKAVMHGNPTSSNLAQESAELWVCLIHLLGAYTAHATEGGIKPLWSLVLTNLQKRDEQSNLKASEKVWETIYCLNALSQFSVYGMTTSQPRLPAAWPLVVFALKKIRLAANATTDKNLSEASLIQRDKYIGVIALRCFHLFDKWKWQLDDASEVFNELGETFRSRKFANLRHEKPDYPLFMLRNDWSLLSQGAKKDSAFALFLKLIVKAGKSDSSSELSPKFKKLLSLAIPVGSLPFTKATPPSKDDLSMLFNRFSAVAIGIYLDRASYKTRVSHVRTYVAFAGADTTTRMAVIRGMMNLANLIRKIELPLGAMAEWISDISLALADELRSIPTLPNESKINGANQEQQPESVAWCHLHICVQMLLSSIRRILGLQNENREYPEPALISSLKPLYTNTRLSHEPKTMHEIQRLTTTLLNSRSNALPLPERPLIASDTNTESQDEYNAAFAAFDFDDPNLIAALVDGGAAGLPVHKANEEKLYGVINETNLFWLCWRNLTKYIQDMNEKPLTIGRLSLLDNRIYCWVGCADVLVRNGSGKSWSMILGQRDEAWKITNEVLRRRVDLGVAMQLLKLHPMMYTTHVDMFLEVFLESFAAEEHTIEHEYASLLLSIDGLRHPLLQELTCMERPGHADYDFSEHEYSALKSVILQTIFRNLNGLLEHEAESSVADSALRNQKFMGYCIKCFSAMRSVSSGLVKESQTHKSYIEWCKQVFRLARRGIYTVIPGSHAHFRADPQVNELVFVTWLLLLGKSMSVANIVARIAFFASDVVVDSQPIGPSVSAFAATLSTLCNNSSQHQPKVLQLPSGADAGSTILRYSNNGFVSFTALSSAQLVSRLILHLSELASRPAVLHLAVTDDLTDVLQLRSIVPYFILSTSPQEAHDHSLLASRLARLEKKAVIHAFYSGGDARNVDQISPEQIAPFLFNSRQPTPSNGRSIEIGLNGHGHGHAMNGQAERQVNGHANGRINGVNGFANGHVSPNHDSDIFMQSDDPELSELYAAYTSTALDTSELLHRPLKAWRSHGNPQSEIALVVVGPFNSTEAVEDRYVITLSLLSPLLPSHLLSAIPTSANRVIVLEQVLKWNTKWLPLYLDVVQALQQRNVVNRSLVQSAILETGNDSDVLQRALESSALRFHGASAGPNTVVPPQPPKHESSYTKLLSHLFGERLEVTNSPSLVTSLGDIATSPEFALGRVRGQLEQRKELIDSVQKLLHDGELDPQLHQLLSQWTLAKNHATKSRTLGHQIISKLESGISSNPIASKVLSLRSHFAAVSRWIIGSDAWSYDLGSSGLHHAIASGLDVNILIIDTVPYTKRNKADQNRRKQDVGLYAMNYGNVYVASVAVFSSYAQVLQAVVEADRHDGPSVVLGYLPYQEVDTPALEVLKETKLAVDTGYWPLYRWDPVKEREGQEPFSLDSDIIKNELRQFLDRQNHLSQLVRSKPEMAAELVSSLGENIKEARKRRAQQSFNELLTSLDAPPVLILYASDGGNAEKVAKRLANRAKVRGLTATIATLDSVPLDSLAIEEYVVFITSTAGQGEPPQNGRQFFKALNAAAGRGEVPLTKLKFAVFGMGDSHYWPRPEDAHYYNKPGKDLNARLEALGGQRVADVGLGDDQDDDGYETGYKAWEPLIWKVLGVDSVEVKEAEPEPITNEHIKVASGYLRGTIVEGLEDTTTGALAPSDTQLTKFHGIYQQDDRDIRDERQVQGLEPAYSFMIRVRMPGGVCKPDQWLQMDQIADEHGSGTFKITTRQTFQFHGVIKKHLKPAIQDINRVLLDTLAACGDVNRNVLCSSVPTMSRLHAQVYEFAKEVSNHLIPRTTAYHEIWLDKKLVAGEAVQDFEPMYGEFYLPRKFKVAVAVPPTNDVDVFANDVGFIAIVDAGGELTGFNVAVGGGMGVTHGNKKTYPRAASIIGFCTIKQGKYVAEKIMLVQRDNGNRVDRKNARLKYTIDRMGLDTFKAKVEELLGYELPPARPHSFDRNIDDFGWHRGSDGKHHFMMFIENGRVQDEPGKEFKKGLREIAKVHKGAFRLTANQHLMVSDIPETEVPRIKALLAQYKLDNLSYSGLRLSSSACVAFPTCGLAMAESERYLPLLVDKVEKICEESGLRNDSIVMRMTGCPNGCARPYLAEVAFVGKALGTYSMLLGGGYYGQRLNKIFRETVTEPEILAILRPMIKRYALERREGERFGDWTIRAGYIAATTEGRAWYDRMGGEGEQREVAATA